MTWIIFHLIFGVLFWCFNVQMDLDSSVSFWYRRLLKDLVCFLNLSLRFLRWFCLTIGQLVFVSYIICHISLVDKVWLKHFSFNGQLHLFLQLYLYVMLVMFWNNGTHIPSATDFYSIFIEYFMQLIRFREVFTQ